MKLILPPSETWDIIGEVGETCEGNLESFLQTTKEKRLELDPIIIWKFGSIIAHSTLLKDESMKLIQILSSFSAKKVFER